MSGSASPRRKVSNIGAPGRQPVNSVMYVRRQHPALQHALSKSEVEPSHNTCEQLFRQADHLLTDIGYKKGKLVPKQFPLTPEHPRRDIRAPGPSLIPPLNLQGFDPEKDSALKIPMRTSVSPEKPLSSFREVPKSAKRTLISVRQSRPDTHRPSVSQVKSRSVREAAQLQEMSPNERSLLRKESHERKELLRTQLRASLSRKLSRSYKLGLFSHAENKVREESLFHLAMTAK